MTIPMINASSIPDACIIYTQVFGVAKLENGLCLILGLVIGIFIGRYYE